MRRTAFNHDDGLTLKIRPQTQQGLRGEFGGVNAGEESLLAHGRFSVSQALLADQVDEGGLRAPALMGVKRWRPLCR
jgi:hypothetical protein